MDELREKVIRGLKCLGNENYSDNPCAGCGYRDCQTFAICVGEIATDALELLKAQEPIKSANIQYDVRIGFCPKCGYALAMFMNYCPKCGQAVKWE